MPRRLKTYQTSSGFFELAVAAPSMKAAAEAWGSRTNVFEQGLAKETHDPAIVAAAMTKPGVVLRRPVGSNGAFSEHAELPKDLLVGQVSERAAKQKLKSKEPTYLDKKAARGAALAFKREQKRREMARRKEEAAREKERKRREEVIAKAERALEQAEHEHEARAREIENDRATLDRRSKAEDVRWERQKEKLKKDLRRGRDEE